MDGLTFKIALFANGDCLISDDRATTLINQDLSTKTWWDEEPSGEPYTALIKTSVEPLAPSRPMLLQAWDIGHRFDTDNRRAEALKLLIEEVKR